MKILDVKALEIPEIQVVRFARFCDERGYFTETFRKSDLNGPAGSECFRSVEFVQGNESHSRAGTVRGLHFQWNPYMGKLVRTLSGRMIDLVLDIRKGSPTFGNIIAYDMPSNDDKDFGEWIWVPPGFAHGNLFTSDSTIEYLCSGEYSPGCEAGISPIAGDIDWSLCNAALRREFEILVAASPIISDKDRDAPSVADWAADIRSQNFLYSSSW